MPCAVVPSVLFRRGYCSSGLESKPSGACWNLYGCAWCTLLCFALFQLPLCQISGHSRKGAPTIMNFDLGSIPIFFPFIPLSRSFSSFTCTLLCFALFQLPLCHISGQSRRGAPTIMNFDLGSIPIFFPFIPLSRSSSSFTCTLLCFALFQLPLCQTSGHSRRGAATIMNFDLGSIPVFSAFFPSLPSTLGYLFC